MSRHGLLVTGGSDYHGSYKPDIDIISGLGDLEVPYELLEALKARAAIRSHRPAMDEVRGELTKTGQRY